jgi:ADP-ribose pyrophosphatase
MLVKILESKKIYSGKIVELIVDSVEKEGRQKVIREVVRHPGGVAVVAELDGKILFVRQRRYPMEKDLLELPAGKLDGTEDPELAAQRELEEETGYRASSLQKIGAFYTSPGFCDELLHIYEAEELKVAKQSLEWDEDIQIERYDLTEALQMIASGEICDAKTAIGVLWLALEKKGTG